jgi:hypothetical protein
MNTLKEVRTAFWNAHPQHTRKGAMKQNNYSTDIRVNFCDYLDQLRKSGEISNKLANNATL